MESIRQEIHSWLSDLANNSIKPGTARRAFDEPLTGCAAGEDQLFAFIKNDIGSDFYWTPSEAFNEAFPEENAAAEELTVLAWILPQTADTRKAHAKTDSLPSIEWSCARHFGEQVNERLRRHVVERFLQRGIQACAPTQLHSWSRAQSKKYGFASRWSERHTAHVCGLGTFGQSDGLITPAGKAVRIGSVIARMRNTPTVRVYQRHNEWCLHQRTGKCLVCARRCPVGAITKDGHDKVRCKEYIRKVTSLYVEREQLGVKVNSCGLCQVKVPCEAKNPLSRALSGGLLQP